MIFVAVNVVDTVGVGEQVSVAVTRAGLSGSEILIITGFAIIVILIAIKLLEEKKHE